MDKVLQIAPRHAGALAGRAEASRQLGHTGEAIGFYRAYLALPPTDTTPELRREADLWVRSLQKSE